MTSGTTRSMVSGPSVRRRAAAAWAGVEHRQGDVGLDRSCVNRRRRRKRDGVVLADHIQRGRGSALGSRDERAEHPQDVGLVEQADRAWA